MTPRAGSLSEAVIAFRAARLQHCLGELLRIGTPQANILRARTLLRLGRPAEARSTAIAGGAAALRNRAELALLHAVAASRLGAVRAAEADEAFVDARAYAISSGDAALEAEVAYYDAIGVYGRQDLDLAREMCRHALELAGSAASPRRTPSTGVVPLPHVVSRVKELQGVIEVAAGRYRDQLPYAQAAIATLDASPIPDVFQAAFAVANLAHLARDFDLPDDAALVADRLDALAWTPDVARSKFRTAEPLGWCAALRGDPIRALGLFRVAADASSTIPERVQIAVDRALISRELGHTVMMTEEVLYALRLAEAFDWNCAADDLRSVLLDLAQIATAVAPARARAMLTRYEQVRGELDVRIASWFEERTRAEEAYTRGIVLRSEGRSDEATRHLTGAFETWQRIDYQWRAGRAAVELTELHAGDVFHLAVARELKQRPASIFAPRASQAVA